MRKVFVDTNVILDVLLQRDAFWQDAMKIFRLAELGELRACVSASSVTDIFYVRLFYFYGGHPAPTEPALPNLINAVSILKSKSKQARFLVLGF